MQNKFYVIVSVPFIERDFDFYIPINKKVGTIKNLIIKMVIEESENAFFDDGCKSLYDKKSGERILEDIFVKDSIIQNGSKLLL